MNVKNLLDDYLKKDTRIARKRNGEWLIKTSL